MQKRHRYCREMPLLTSTYHSTRKWGRALYTHHTTEMAKGEFTVDPADNILHDSISWGRAQAHRQSMCRAVTTQVAKSAG